MLLLVLFVAAASFINRHIRTMYPLLSKFNVDLYKTHIKTNGFDQRPQNASINGSETASILEIRGYFEKKLLLETLQNPNVPIQVKMRLLEDVKNSGCESVVGNEYRHYDLFAGGLMRDFEFEIE